MPPVGFKDKLSLQQILLGERGGNGPGREWGRGGMSFGLELIGIMQIENDNILIACIK